MLGGARPLVVSREDRAVLAGRADVMHRVRAAGDLLATIRIVLPESKDADLDTLMEKWRDSKPYNPRGND